MKTRIIGTGLMFLAISLLSCEEDAKPTKVYGQLHCGECTSGFVVDGTLGTGGEDYYGHCTRSGDNLSFAIGQGDPTSSSFTSELYYEVNGIVGPPVVGVYDEDGDLINNESNYRTFASAKVYNTNQWSFSQDDINPDECYVSLFAEPLIEETDEGEVEEVTPDQFGNMPFELFVNINCLGLSVDSVQGQTLTWMTIRVWFDRCD